MSKYLVFDFSSDRIGKPFCFFNKKKDLATYYFLVFLQKKSKERGDFF